MLNYRHAAAAAIACLATAAPAAEPVVNVEGRPTIFVSYADLNLASSTGRAALERRVHQAAKTLCIDNRVFDLQRAMAGRACFQEAKASGKLQIAQALRSGQKERLAANSRVMVSIRR